MKTSGYSHRRHSLKIGVEPGLGLPLVAGAAVLLSSLAGGPAEAGPGP